MQEEEKIMAGVLFCPADPELKQIKLRTHKLNQDYNSAYEDETEKRRELILQIVGEIGADFFLQGPIYFHYGKHTKIGKNFFANFNFTVQDDAPVTIGDHCNFGPNVTIVTPVHPMLPQEREAMLDAEGNRKHLCYAKPVQIGSNCWLGGKRRCLFWRHGRGRLCDRSWKRRDKRHSSALVRGWKSLPGNPNADGARQHEIQTGNPCGQQSYRMKFIPDSSFVRYKADAQTSSAALPARKAVRKNRAINLRALSFGS